MQEPQDRILRAGEAMYSHPLSRNHFGSYWSARRLAILAIALGVVSATCSAASLICLYFLTYG